MTSAFSRLREKAGDEGLRARRRERADDMTELNRLDAHDAVARLQRREITAVELLRACLERIAAREAEVRAFVRIDADAALAQARALDAGPIRGPLHGLPLGVKDLLDTADLPTAYGTPLYARHQPAADAAAVALCREAGAVIVGKTVTTELAYFTPGPTRNPLALAYTPGGSSSGSAAAVADAMLPLALGTQTAGSIIRPAAYCGIVGFKPSWGRVPRTGLKGLSDSLDTIGGFARSVRDAALLAGVLTSDTRLARCAEDAVAAPRIGWCRTPWWGAADADAQSAFADAQAALAPRAVASADPDLPDGFDTLVDLQKSVMAWEMARSLSHERLRHRDGLSAKLCALIDEGLAIDGTRHACNLATLAAWRARTDALFGDCDVIVAPSTTGEAPAGLEATGDPLFCRAWTALGLPCVHLPFARGAHGLPVGVQLVGRIGDDHRLLAFARWTHERLRG